MPYTAQYFEIGLGKTSVFRPSGGSGGGETEKVMFLAVVAGALQEHWTSPGADEFTGDHTQWRWECASGTFSPTQDNVWAGQSVHTPAPTKPSSTTAPGQRFAYEIHHGDWGQGQVVARWLRVVRSGGFTDFWILGEDYDPTDEHAYVTRLATPPASVQAFLDLSLGVTIKEYARVELDAQ